MKTLKETIISALSENVSTTIDTHFIDEKLSELSHALDMIMNVKTDFERRGEKRGVPVSQIENIVEACRSAFTSVEKIESAVNKVLNK